MRAPFVRPCDLDFRHYCISAIRWPCSPNSHCGVFRAVSGLRPVSRSVCRRQHGRIQYDFCIRYGCGIRLVRIREDAGADAFWRSSNRLLLQAMLGGLLFRRRIIRFGPSPHADYCRRLFRRRKSGGGGTDDILRALGLGRHSLLCGFGSSKSLWDFHWVFGAETVAMVVSILVLWRWHNSVACLPIAFGCGYLVAALMFFTAGCPNQRAGPRKVCCAGWRTNISPTSSGLPRALLTVTSSHSLRAEEYRRSATPG